MRLARRDLAGQAAAHLVLATYTVIALFPILLVLMNSLKTRRAIFGAPLTPPTPETFTLQGFQTVLAQGNFVLYFGNSLTVTLVSLFLILLFGAMAAFALAEYRFPGNALMGLFLALGIMIPIRLGTVGILDAHGSPRSRQHADGADPGLHRAGPAACDLHPLGVHAHSLARP